MNNEFAAADEAVAKLQEVCESDFGMRAVVIDTLKALIATIQLDGDAGFPCWNESDLQHMIDKLNA